MIGQGRTIIVYMISLLFFFILIVELTICKILLQMPPKKDCDNPGGHTLNKCKAQESQAFVATPIF